MCLLLEQLHRDTIERKPYILPQNRRSVGHYLPLCQGCRCIDFSDLKFLLFEAR